MTANTFGKYNIQITKESATTLLELVQALDYPEMTVGQVLDLNMLQAQLEAVTEA